MPAARAAIASSLTTSPLPFFHGLDATECFVVFVCQRQNPSWCFAVRTTYLQPAVFAVRTHCRASSLVGLKTFGSSFPSPHSRSEKVLTPKWKNIPISASCQASCEGVGRGAILLQNIGPRPFLGALSKGPFRAVFYSCNRTSLFDPFGG